MKRRFSWAVGCAALGLWAYTIAHYLHGAFGYQGYGDFYLMLGQVRTWLQTGAFPTDTAFLYPPFFYVLTAPLAWLQDEAAASVMVWLNQGLLIATLWLLYRTLSPRPKRAWLVWVLGPLMLNHRLLLTTLSMAKIEMLQLFLLVATCAAYQRRRDRLAGALLAVAGAVKPLPLLLILYFLAKREWRVVAAWTVTLSGILAGCAVLIGWQEVWIYFVHAALPARGDQTMLSWTESQSLLAFTMRLFHTGEPVFMMPASEMAGLPTAVASGLRVLVAAIIGALVWPAGERHPQRVAAEWSLALIGMLLISPFSRDYYAVFLLPAYAWLAHRALCQPSWWRWPPAWLGLLSYLFVGQGFPLGIVNRLPPIVPWANNLHIYMYYSVPTWGYLLLLAAWAHVCVHEREGVMAAPGPACETGGAV